MYTETCLSLTSLLTSSLTSSLTTGPAAKEIKRQATVKAAKRSRDPKEWGAPEVLQFLHENGLDSFKPVLYRNGVVGKTLLKLRSNMFPAGKFTEEEMQKFDQELIRLRLSGM